LDKKALRKQYKETLQPMGVFKVQNKVNGKILIISSNNIPGRINREKFQLDMGGHPHKDLQKDYKEFGKDNFIFEIVDNLKPKEDPAYNYSDDLDMLEEMWLDKLQPYGDKGYNEKKPAK
jgi:hypothetical protein